VKRLYEAVVSEHFSEHRQMLFLMGPRQVAKRPRLGKAWRIFRNPPT